MKFNQHSASSWFAVLAILCSTTLASAQTFELSWFSVDGGGVVGSTGGAFAMSSTIGQPDPGAMSGGDFELTGGFWSVAGSSRYDPCDMNCDGTVDASDIEFFIDILFNGATPCDTCTGDTNGDGMVNAGDIQGFINCLFP